MISAQIINSLFLPHTYTNNFYKMTSNGVTSMRYDDLEEMIQNLLTHIWISGWEQSCVKVQIYPKDMQ